MLGYCECSFVGGPLDGKKEEMSSVSCKDFLGIPGKSWFSERKGKFSVVKGEKYFKYDPNWVFGIFHLYKKKKKLDKYEKGNTYLFVENLEVRRCKSYIPSKGRRCWNEALDSGDFCRVHSKGD